MEVLEGENIALTPNRDYTAMVGEVSLVALGNHVLEVAGIRRVPLGTGEKKPPSKSIARPFLIDG
jgi:hypothetical protein